MSKSTAPASLVDGTTWPAKMLACTAPGWSIRNTRGCLGRATCADLRLGRRVAGALPVAEVLVEQRHDLLQRGVADDDQRRVLSGRTQSRWKATRSSRVSEPIDASVPLPLNGIA